VLRPDRLVQAIQVVEPGRIGLHTGRPGADWRRPRQPLHVLYPSNRHLSAKTRLFVDWVAEVFAPFDDR
jgi:DNA-binding transcriptional LysR family regulator